MRFLIAAAVSAVSAFSFASAVIAPDEIVAASGVKVELGADGTVFVASSDPVDEVKLRWKRQHSPQTLLLRNDWERDYREAGWCAVSNDLGSAWYVMIKEPHGFDGWGVEVQPNALCWWRVTPGEIELVLDVRSADEPVRLAGRTLRAAKLVMRRGRGGESAFAAGREFCRLMCPKPRLPKEPVYGYNDWYCAYGSNTATNFLADAACIVALCEGLSNRPYVVMDDGWQKNSPPVVKTSGCGPWDESGPAFGMPMKEFVERVAALGAKPGLWYRPYRAWKEAPDSLKMAGNPLSFDPTAPGLTERFTEEMTRFRRWGIKLVKMDFLVRDTLGVYAFPRQWGARPCRRGIRWRDASRTTCEVLLDHYRVLRAAAGDDVVLIGCNMFDHLAAGIVEVQRTGGDTSGLFWRQTLEMGVNALAARSIHDGIFYAADADCVGLAWEGAVDWSLNSQWLDLVSRSGTPLFVSWRRSLATAEVRAALRKAFATAARPRATAEPLDWMLTPRPRRWRFADASEGHYEWDALRAMRCDGRVARFRMPENGGKSGREEVHRFYRSCRDSGVKVAVMPTLLRTDEYVAYGLSLGVKTLGEDEFPDGASSIPDFVSADR